MHSALHTLYSPLCVFGTAKDLPTCCLVSSHVKPPSFHRSLFHSLVVHETKETNISWQVGDKIFNCGEITNYSWRLLLLIDNKDQQKKKRVVLLQSQALILNLWTYSDVCGKIFCHIVSLFRFFFNTLFNNLRLADCSSDSWKFIVKKKKKIGSQGAFLKFLLRFNLATVRHGKM